MASLHLTSLPSEQLKEDTKEQSWSPYFSNEGTALGVAGKDFAIIAGDTRMSRGYSIASRKVPKCCVLTDKVVLGSSGMQAEATTLRKVLNYKMVMYQHKHNKQMGVAAAAQMLSNTLYYKRFFPYYAFNVLGGVDEEGHGHIYGYDAVGSFQRIPYGVAGSGSALVTSLFDNQFGFLTQQKNKKDLSLEETLDLVRDAFTCCGERDIYTGDSVDIHIITKDGIRHETFLLKKD